MGAITPPSTKPRIRISLLIRVKLVASTPIEMYGVVAEYRTDGQGPAVTAWCNFHGPFVLQPLVAACLGLPPTRLRIIVPEDIGGSFGICCGNHIPAEFKSNRRTKEPGNFRYPD
jgi:CO/xanthine dehydrogenase Mo-binding subunit